MPPIEAKLTILVPQDCLEFLIPLIQRLGGQVMERAALESGVPAASGKAGKPGISLEEGDEIVVVPPPPDHEWPGRMCKGLRCRENLSREDLAAALGVPAAHIEEYENFSRPIPREKAGDLARILRASVHDFTHGPTDEA